MSTPWFVHCASSSPPIEMGSGGGAGGRQRGRGRRRTVRPEEAAPQRRVVVRADRTSQPLAVEVVQGGPPGGLAEALERLPGLGGVGVAEALGVPGPAAAPGGGG